MGAHSSRNHQRLTRVGMGVLLECEDSEGTLVCRLHSQETLLPPPLSQGFCGVWDHSQAVERFI